MELIVAKVEGGVDWLERLEVDVDLPLLAFRSKNFTTVNHQPVWWNFVVKLQSLLCRCNGREDGLAIDAGLDV